MNRPAKAQFVRSWATLLESGVAMESALDHQAAHAANPSARTLALSLRDHIRAGMDLDQALQVFPSFVREGERAMLKAGSQTGRLPDCLRLLGEQWEEQHRARLLALSRMILPIIVVHLAVRVVTLPVLFAGGQRFAHFFAACIKGFFGIWVLAGLLVLVFKWLQQLPAFESLAYRTPLVGKWLRLSAASRFCQALYFYLVAGVPMLRALPGAGAASASQTLLGLSQSGGERMVSDGASLGDVLADSNMFSHEQLAVLEAGEHGGRLDDALQHLAQLTREEASRAMQRLALVLPSIIYFVIALLVILRIFSYAFAYVNLLNKIMSGG